MKKNKMICIIDDDPLFIEGTKTIIDMSGIKSNYIV